MFCVCNQVHVTPHAHTRNFPRNRTLTVSRLRLIARDRIYTLNSGHLQPQLQFFNLIPFLVWEFNEIEMRLGIAAAVLTIWALTSLEFCEGNPESAYVRGAVVTRMVVLCATERRCSSSECNMQIGDCALFIHQFGSELSQRHGKDSCRIAVSPCIAVLASYQHPQRSGQSIISIFNCLIIALHCAA